jgi:hypothetical protein
MGIGGKAIPPNVDKVEDMRSDAQFILLVEKDAAFMRLAEDRFYNKYPCIIITGKGQPDVATRYVLTPSDKQDGAGRTGPGRGRRRHVLTRGHCSLPVSS